MKILIFPKDINPYQELLYSPMRNNQNVRTKYVRRLPIFGAFLLPIIVMFRRIQGYRLIHVHWPAFTLDLPLSFNKKLSYYFFIYCIGIIKKLGFVIVWTVHNVMPHEPQTSNDRKTAAFLASEADAKIVHSSYTIEQMKELYFDTERAAVIPHGNYIDVYPRNMSRADARKRLQISSDKKVILFFGNIRSYKGVDDLLDAYRRTGNAKTCLVIAGSCDDSKLRRRIIESQSTMNIIFYDGRVRDEDVEVYFNACDLVCLPFKSITTSGSALLALSYGKPLVAPSQGSLLDMPKDVGYFYDPHAKNALEVALAMALKDKELAKRCRKAFAYAQTLSWDRIALETYELYQEVLEPETMPRNQGRANKKT